MHEDAFSSALLRCAELERRTAQLEQLLVEQETALATLSAHLQPEALANCLLPALSLPALSKVLKSGAALTPAELFGSLAHELNQPLTVIATFGRACLRLVQNDQAKKEELIPALEQIAEQAEQAGRFVQHLRAQLISGKVMRIRVQLNSQILKVVHQLENRILLEKIHLQLQLAEELPEVLGDSLQLEQVLLNVIGNAVEAMAQTPPEQRVLKICSSRAGEEVTVTVSDTGTGLAEAVAAHLFQPFHTTKASGMGLGLALCRSIIQAHQGRIGAKPNTGPGTTFFFSLPFTPGA